MRPKTEILLYRLAWRAEQFLRPTIGILSEGFDAWAVRQGELDRIHELEALGFLERHPDSNAKGACLALSKAFHSSPCHRSPPSAWRRKWKGKWIQIIFDIEARNSTTRKALHRTLRQNGFGCLQGSVWIHPFLNATVRRNIRTLPGRPENLLLLESSTCGKHTNRWIVEDAWNWEEIEKRIDRYLQDFPHPPTDTTVKECLSWVRKEQRAWTNILSMDPLLPNALLPQGYPGKTAWKHRQRILSQMDTQLDHY